jgi:hypothetical protein
MSSLGDFGKVFKKEIAMTKKVLLLLCALGITFGNMSASEPTRGTCDRNYKKEKKERKTQKRRERKEKRERKRSEECHKICCPTCKKTVNAKKVHTCKEKDIKKAGKKAAHKRARKTPCADCNKKTCKCKCTACHHPKKRCECPVCPTCNMNENNCGCVRTETIK